MEENQKNSMELNLWINRNLAACMNDLQLSIT